MVTKGRTRGISREAISGGITPNILTFGISKSSGLVYIHYPLVLGAVVGIISLD